MDPLTVGMGLLSFGGSIFANRSNAREAQKNRDFQRDMSSTSAQRAVADYKAAGLNPALAYERGAPMASGGQAVLGDPIATGVSSAREAASLKQRLQIERQQAEADIELKKSQALAVRQQGQQAVEQQALTAAQTRREMQQLLFQQALFPSQQRQQMADALLKEYLLPGAKYQSRWDEKAGIFKPILTDLFTGVRGISPLMRR